MSSKFNSIYSKFVKTPEIPAVVKEAVPEVKQEPVPVKESVEPVKRQKVTLVSPFNPLEDKTSVTVESLQLLGFKSASPEDFIGAKDTTYFMDVPNTKGRTTLVYDFQPLGNQGRPAAHVYYSANTDQISESLVCFSANSNLGEIRQLIESAKNLNPTVPKNVHDIKGMPELIKEVNNSGASVNVL